MQTGLGKEMGESNHTPKSWAVSFHQVSSLEEVGKEPGKNSKILPPGARRQLDSSHTSTRFQRAANGGCSGSDRMTGGGIRKQKMSSQGQRGHWLSAPPKTTGWGRKKPVPPLKGELPSLESPVSFALSFPKGLLLFALMDKITKKPPCPTQKKKKTLKSIKNKEYPPRE